jgi:hypothetical protein
VIAGFCEGDREAVDDLVALLVPLVSDEKGVEGKDEGTNNATDNEEPNNDLNCVRDALCVCTDLAVDRDFPKILAANGEVEDRADADRSEEPDEGRLKQVLNLVDVFVHRENDGDAADEEDENSEENEAVERDDVVA